MKVILNFIAVMAVVITTCHAQNDMDAGNGNPDPAICPQFTSEAPFVSPGISLAGFSNTDNVTLTDLPGGTYEVGDNQTVLKKLTDVAAQLNGANVLGNVIYELNTTYNGTTGETFPVVFNQFATTGGNWTVTIRVKSGVTTRATSGNTANPLITLNGADNITFDGRAAGTGSTIAWNIYNSNTGGIAINLLNDAQSNAIRYCDLVAVNPASGVVVFGSTTGNQGNDNNTVAYCNIHDDGINFPSYGIVSSGRTTTTSAFNSGNSILNCNIYNFYLNGGISSGISIDAGSTSWSIQGNSFYQTSARNPTNATSFYLIYINCGDGYAITGNYLGGSAPSCGGTPWTLTGANTPKVFFGILFGFLLETNNANSIQGNTISNLYIETGANGNNTLFFAGMLLYTGIQNIGNITPNVIGSGTATGSITMNLGLTNLNYFYGILSQAPSGIIQNNIIGGINLSGTLNNILIIYLVSVSTTGGAEMIVSGNFCGSLTTAGSIQVNIASNQTIRFYGYLVGGSDFASTTITQNTLANIVLNNTNSGSFIQGYRILTYYPGSVFSSNLARDLTVSAPNTSSSITAFWTYTSVPTTVSQNQAYNLINTGSTGSATIYGIYLTGPTYGTTIVERNLIHSFTFASTSSTSLMTGIHCVSGKSMYRNNMVRLGINPDGSALTAGCQINGINEVTGTNNIYNNSIYIGGTGISGTTGNTYCFNSSSTNNLRIIQNNIFCNTRSGGTTGKHYAIRVAGTGLNPAGLNSNYNLLQANGATGGTLGYYSTDMTTLSAWKNATGQDMASGNGDPNFVNPNGSGSVVNLHVQSPTPVEGAGIILSDVSNDYDGQARSGLTPTDIGADAGNFTSGPDLFGPKISYTPLGNGYIWTLRILNGFAIITDNQAVASGTSNPRLYYKKSTDANTFGGNTSLDNGWKYVVASNSSSPYSFTINHSILFGGSVSQGDVIQYFVVAQDVSNNLSSWPQGAVAGVNPPVQNINGAPAILYQYTIAGTSLIGPVNVPGDYPTLTGTGGLFEAINNGLVMGNIVANITANLTEPGTVALNQFNEEPFNSNYSLTIQAGSVTERVISGVVASGMIRFDGADRVTIDGRYNGSGRYLRFRNTDVAGPVFDIRNDATNITLRNCIVEGANAGTSSGLIVIGTTVSNPGTGNDNITITENLIRDRSDATGVPYTLIYSSGTAIRENSEITISNNELFNFSNYGINTTSTGNGGNWSISGNSFYCNLATPPSTSQYSVNFIPGQVSGGNTISNNFIGGTSSGCGGTPWINSGAVSFYGIYFNVGMNTATSVQNNTIRNISLTNTGSAPMYGIYHTGAGLCNVSGNTVGNSSGTSSINISGTGTFYGIYLGTNLYYQSIVQNNLVRGISHGSAGSASFYGLYLASGLNNVSNNTIGNPAATGAITISGSGTVYGIYASCSGILNNNTIANILQSGTSAGVFYGMYFTGTNIINANANYIIGNGPSSSSASTGDVTGFYYAGSNQRSITCTFTNNIISQGHGITNNHVYKGIDDNSQPYNNFRSYYNSISLGGSCSGTSASFAFIKRNTGNTTQLDNIFSNIRINGSTGTGKHYAAGITNTSGNFTSNYNNLYSAGPVLAVWSTTDQANLSAWQSATAADLASKSVNPNFYSTSDLHTCHPQLDGAGIAITGITTDYMGAPRGNPPDIGAYEFTSVNPTITGPTTLCSGTTGVTYITQSGYSGYVWTVSAGGTITSGSGTSTITVTWNVAGAQTVSVNYSAPGGCAALSPTVLNVTVNPTPSPTITGPNNVCAGVGNINYTTEPGMTNYTWTLSPGGTIQYGQGTSMIAVIWNNAGAQSVSVNYTNSFGCPAWTPTLYPVMVNTVPGPAGAITGASSVCAGNQGIAYSTTPITNVTTYVWMVPPGATIVSGSGTTSIIVDFSENATSGNVTVCGNNLCGNGTTSSLSVTVNPIPATPLISLNGLILSSDAPNGNQWYKDGLMIPGATAQTYNAAEGGNGEYWDVVTLNGCSSDTSNHIHVLVTGQQEMDKEMFTIYPVPNDGRFAIKMKGHEWDAYTIYVYSSLGKQIFEKTLSAVNGISLISIDIRPVAEGLYTVMILGNNTRSMHKILIRK